MTELVDRHEQFDDVASMVRAAGAYVRASEDLRPRVLEAARLQRRERGTQRWMQYLAVLVLMLALVTVVDRRDLSTRQSRSMSVVATAGFDGYFSPSAISSDRGVEGDWWMFEAFTKLRRHQARVLRLEI